MSGTEWWMKASHAPRTKRSPLGKTIINYYANANLSRIIMFIPHRVSQEIRHMRKERSVNNLYVKGVSYDNI